MQRYPAFDPPEYVSWHADPSLIEEFDATWRRDEHRAETVLALSRDALLGLYRGLVRARLHDIALKRWVWQGVISKAWLGTGEEATTIGPVHALNRAEDIVAPMIRNAAASCEMGMPVADMLRGYLGTADSPSRGRDGHVGDFSRRVLQPVSHIGSMPPVICGIALAFVLRSERRVALTWIGDGSVNAGATHEALNFAAVLRLPAIFIIQNNQIALGTPVNEHHPTGHFDELHEAYGCAGWAFDGNNVLDAFAATKLAVDRCRAGEGPVILSAATFRMGGHATHDEQDARRMIPAETYAYWGARDPIGLYEEQLKRFGVGQKLLDEAERQVIEEVDEAIEGALGTRDARTPQPESAVFDVYAPTSAA